MLFRNRKDAGQKLAEELKSHFATELDIRTEDVVVIGLPRGGVIVALEVSRQFGCPLDVIVSKKIPYPEQPEFAIGAVSSDDVIVLNPDIPHNLQWQQYLNQQHHDLLQFSRNLESEFYEAAGYAPTPLKGKTVFVVDDGIATGMTAKAALKAVRQRGAKTIILAAPVMSQDSVDELAEYCDSVVPVYIPVRLNSVGQHYIDFTQTSNEQVIQAMRSSKSFSTSPPTQNMHDFTEAKA
ncbi:MAG TPA: phosphoribosyltransferase family protein [Drouetiella sp.]|jgi:putative phosphoribosyl transferase